MAAHRRVGALAPLGLLVLAVLPLALAQPVRPPIVIVPGLQSSDLKITIANSLDVTGLIPCALAGTAAVDELRLKNGGRSALGWIYENPSDPLATGYRAFCALLLVDVTYNPKTRKYAYPKGVAVTVDTANGLGGLVRVPGTSKYPTFGEMLSFLGQLNYTLNVDVFPATYNFMLADAGLKQFGWYKAIRSVIVKAYAAGQAATPKQKVILVAHSMGTLVTASLLQQDTAFAKKYIQSVVFISPLFAGLTLAWPSILLGYKDNTNTVNAFNYFLWKLKSRSPSSTWMMPYNGSIFPADQVLARVNSATAGADPLTVTVANQKASLAALFREPTPSSGDGMTDRLVSYYDNAHNFDSTFASLTSQASSGALQSVRMACLYAQGTPTAAYVRTTPTSPWPYGYAPLLSYTQEQSALAAVQAVEAAPVDGDDTVSLTIQQACTPLAQATGGATWTVNDTHSSVPYNGPALYAALTWAGMSGVPFPSAR